MSSTPEQAAPAPRYVIATVDDFLKVPEDRIRDCLLEFADYLNIVRWATEAASGLCDVEAGPFTWIDDGKQDRTIGISLTGTL